MDITCPHCNELFPIDKKKINELQYEAEDKIVSYYTKVVMGRQSKVYANMIYDVQKRALHEKIDSDESPSRA